MRVCAKSDWLRLKAEDAEEQIGFILFKNGLCKLASLREGQVPASEKAVGFFELRHFAFDPELGGEVVPFRAFRAWVRDHRALIGMVAQIGGYFPEDAREMDAWHRLEDEAANFGMEKAPGAEEKL